MFESHVLSYHINENENRNLIPSFGKLNNFSFQLSSKLIQTNQS